MRFKTVFIQEFGDIEPELREVLAGLENYFEHKIGRNQGLIALPIHENPPYVSVTLLPDNQLLDVHNRRCGAAEIKNSNDRRPV